MSLSTKIALGAMAAALFSAVNLYAVDIPAGDALIDDCEGGTNENKFGAYWYYYDDAADEGTSTIKNAPKVGKEYTVAPTTAEGNNGTAGYVLDYTIGTKCKTGCTWNYVGAGTMLATEGNVCDLTGATKITYWAKANPPVTLNVEVAISDITNFNYHRTLQKVTATWAKYEIILKEGTGIGQQAWGETKVPFNPKHVTKIQWQVHSEQKPEPAGKLYLDDVSVGPYTFIPPDVKMSCIGPAGAGATLGAALSTLDVLPYNQNAAKGYWYCYNDVGKRAVTSQTEFSAITAGATIDATSLTTAPLLAIDGQGQNSTNGAYIEFELGKNYIDAGTTVRPFVGLGTSLSDKLETTYYNAKADGATGVYFDYKTSGTALNMRFECVADNVAFKNPGIVHYLLFPNTKGEWKGAKVLFTDLMLPNWKEVTALTASDKAINTAALKKLQWAVQDGAGTTGSLAIDNVYMIGATKITPIGAGAPVVFQNANQKNAGIRALFANHNLMVTLTQNQAIASGSVALLNAKGATIAHTAVQPTAANATVAKTLNVGNVAKGIYFYTVTLNYANGLHYTTKVPVSIF
jgi:hypothetical protein